LDAIHEPRDLLNGKLTDVNIDLKNSENSDEFFGLPLFIIKIAVFFFLYYYKINLI